MTDAEIIHLSFDQDEVENRAAFIARLVRAGWTRKAAREEWEREQEEDESGY